MELIPLLFGLLVTVTAIATGVYIGVLRALDVYFGEEDSVFLSDERDGRW